MYHILLGAPRQAIGKKGEIDYHMSKSLRLDSLTRARPDMPKPLLEWMCRCLSHEPTERPQDYAALFQSFLDAMKASGIAYQRVESQDSSAPLPELGEHHFYNYLRHGLKLGHSDADRICATLVRASQLIAAGQYGAAREGIASVLEAHPNLGQGYALLGQVHLAQKERDKATKHYEKALEIWRADATAIAIDQQGYLAVVTTLARLLCDIDSPSFDAARAINLARLGVQLRPESAKCRLTLGMALLVNGSLSDASKELAQAKKLDPNNRNVLKSMAIISRLQGQEPQLFLNRAEAANVDSLVHRYSEHLRRSTAR